MGFSFAYFKNDFTLFFLNIGLLGSFTTFSSFSLQALKYMQAGLWDKMLYFIIFSVLSGIIGCYIGYRLGSKLT
jgi:CrcB protein